jgi:hypothetical protein
MDKEQRRAYNQAYYLAHREKLIVDAHTYRKTHKEEIRVREGAYYLTRKRMSAGHGLTLNEKRIRAEHQGYRCEICGKVVKRLRNLQVDHSHSNKHIRGLLCVACNHMLGCVNDNPELLRKAIHYLSKYDGLVQIEWEAS